MTCVFTAKTKSHDENKAGISHHQVSFPSCPASKGLLAWHCYSHEPQCLLMMMIPTFQTKTCLSPVSKRKRVPKNQRRRLPKSPIKCRRLRKSASPLAPPRNLLLKRQRRMVIRNQRPSGSWKRRIACSTQCKHFVGGMLKIRRLDVNGRLCSMLESPFPNRMNLTASKCSMMEKKLT